jgi:hypothetical protein
MGTNTRAGQPVASHARSSSGGALHAAERVAWAVNAATRVMLTVGQPELPETRRCRVSELTVSHKRAAGFGNEHDGPEQPVVVQAAGMWFQASCRSQIATSSST